MPRSFVAVGDSFTEGLHDELGPDGRHRGWADRVAEALAAREGGLRYANLAVRGRLLRQVVQHQIPAAAGCAPELVSFHAGGNDVLRPRTDIRALLAEYERAVAMLREVAPRILLFTVIGRAGGTGRLADRLERRFALFNRGIRETATRHGALLVDLGAVAALQDRRLWHEDRLHLTAAGHARVTAAVLEALGERDSSLLGGAPGWWRAPLPPAAPLGRRSAMAADLRWIRGHLLPWVGRRLRGVSSGDQIASKHVGLIELARPGTLE